jgi:hypothetical protein
MVAASAKRDKTATREHLLNRCLVLHFFVLHLSQYKKKSGTFRFALQRIRNYAKCIFCTFVRHYARKPNKDQ